jgi:flavin-dependent dehydrogenase
VWIWYDTIPEDSSDFKETFTDVDGKSHLTTIPRGKIDPKVWQRVSSRGTKPGNPQFAELIRSITEPLVSAIRDFPGSKSVFCDGKVLLVGDAFSLCRPHTGGSTSQAAFQALELIKVLDSTLALEQWEKACVESAAAERARSLGAAGFFFGGEMPQFVKDMMAQGQK